MTIVPKFVDLSHYDDLQDIAKVKAAGILGIVNKATEGPGMVDKTFTIRRPVVGDAGMLYGAYHFVRPGNMAQQAAHFLEVVGDPTGLLLALDHEVAGVSLADAQEWLQIVHDRVGRWPVYYSYSAMLMQSFGARQSAFFSQVRLWLASYTATPRWPTEVWPSWWGWQYTGDSAGQPPHNVPGIVLEGGKGIDMNAFNGTDQELIEQWGA